MSRLTLLAGADPKACACGPIVRLQAGFWVLEYDGLVDSAMTIELFKSQEPLPVVWRFVAKDRIEIDIPAPTNVRVSFMERGTEKYISIFARRLVDEPHTDAA